MRGNGFFRQTWVVSLVLPWVLLGAGCSGPPREPDLLRVGNGAEPAALDPHLVSGVSEHRVLSALFEGLATINPATLEPEPAVAARWEASPDGLVWRFHLDPDARWSDGTPVTAGDFVYAWRRMLSPALGSEYAYMLHCLAGARAFNEGQTTDFSTVGARALSDGVLEVQLDHPTPYLLKMQSHFAWYPVKAAAVEAAGRVDDRNNPWARPGTLVSNGPFRLAEWQPNDQIRLERNPYYRRAGSVRLPGIVFYPVDNQQTEERLFRAGLLDLTSTVPRYKIPVYRQRMPERLQSHPYLGTYFYRFNVTRSPLNDPRVRRALVMALDRKELAERVLKGGEIPADRLVPEGMAGYRPPEGIPYDPEGARRLLAEAGYPEGRGMRGLDLLFNTSEAHRLIAEAAQRMWRETLGIRVTLRNQDWKVYLASMDSLDYDIARSAWIADVPDAVNFLECFLAGGGNNRTGWSSETYDQLIREAYREADPDRRAVLLARAEALLLDEAPIAPVYFYRWTFLMNPEVRGLVPNPLGFIRWTDLWLERQEGGE